MTTMVLPSFSKRTSTASLVVPGVSLTITLSEPTMALTSVLLPAFRLPTMAIRITGLAGLLDSRCESSSNILSSRTFLLRLFVADMHRNSPKPSRENSPAPPNILAESALLAAPMTFRLCLRSSLAICSSKGTRPSRISTMKRTKSADSRACRICPSMCSLSRSLSTIPYPPVSISSK